MNQTHTPKPTTYQVVGATSRHLLRGGLVVALLAQATLGHAQTPTVTSLTPVRNANSAPLTTNVAVGFSQPLSTNAATQQALKVFSAQSGGKKAGTATVSGSTLTFDPSTDLKAGEKVFGTVTAAAQSSGGVAARPHVFQFTTAVVPSLGTFQGSGGVAVGNEPKDVAVGDIDGDGDIDLVAACWNYGSGVASVRLNNGNGTFSGSQNIALETNPLSVVLGDVDSDGDLDLLALNNNFGYSTVSIRLNNGAGAFSGTQQASVAWSSQDLAVGDIDGDGDLDLLAAGSNLSAPGSLISIRLNNGQGAFTGSQELSIPGSTTSISLGDLDNDGDLDLAAASADNLVRVRLNNGQGIFEGTQQVSVGSNPTHLALGDIDGDGDLDLVTANNSGGTASVRLNSGNSTFGGNQEVTLPENPTSVTLGDVDGDQDLDLIAAGSNASVRLNNGQGTFTGTQQVTIDGYLSQVTLADVDGDKDLDLLATTYAAVNVRLNQNLTAPVVANVTPSAGTVGSTAVITGTGLIGATSVTFNGVPATNFVVNSAIQITATVPAGATSGPLVVTTPLGSSNGVSFIVGPLMTVTGITPPRNARAVARTSPVAVTFSQPLNTSTATQQALRVFSQQAGGKKAGTATISGNTLTFAPGSGFRPGETVFGSVTTVAQSTSNATLGSPQVFQFTTAAAASPGTFAGGSEVSVGSKPQNVVLGDVDGDGDLDMMTANNSSTNLISGLVSLRLNNGDGTYDNTYSNEREINVGPGPYNLVLGDVDGDGDLDLLSASANGNTISVRLNDGKGIFVGNSSTPFSGAQEVYVESSPHALALGDVDGDGDLDLLAANYTSATSSTGSTVSIRLNNGSGLFSGGSEVAVGSRPTALALGDLDNDGDLDLVVPSSNSFSVGVRFNNGGGTFSGTQTVNVANNPEAVALGDVDGDGDLDLLTGNTGTNSVSVRLNDGSGAFSGTQNVTVADGPRSLNLADVDGDGDLDFVTASYGRVSFSGIINGTTASVRINNGSGVFSGTQNVTVGTQPNGVAVGDVDNDGDLDFVTANTVSNTVSVRLNQVLAGPTITSLTPIAGPVGSTVVITGTNFLNASNSGVTVSSVTFNGTPAPGFVVNSATQITVAVPAGATTGPVVVNTTIGASNAVLFTVAPRPIVTAVSPTRNAPAAPRTTAVAVTYDQPLSNNAVTQQGIRVFSFQAGGKKAGTATVSGNTLTLTPATGFKAGETVFTSVTPTVQGSIGNLALPQVFQFTTATNPSTGTFFGGTDFTIGTASNEIVTADADGDGDLDLLTATQGNVTIRFNNGNGTFSTAQIIIQGRNYVGVQVGDLDNDTDLDLVTIAAGGFLDVLLNNGNGTFTPPLFSIADYNTTVSLGDVDGDGDLDLLTTNVAGSLVVYRNEGNGSFANGMSNGVSISGGSRSAIGDVDGDGDLDVLVAVNAANSGVSIRFNNGAGVFNTQQFASVGSYAASVALGDLDADGDLDLVTVSNTTGLASVRLNDGKGTFSGTQEVAIGNGSVSVRLSDVDGNGALDLLTTNSRANTVSVRLNDGTGKFTLSTGQEVAVGATPTNLALGDLDGDGTLDLLTTNATNVSVRLNQNQPLPALANVAPALSAVGNAVVITGTNLSQTTKVTFNGTPVKEILAASATQLTVVVPEGATTGALVVTTTAGVSNSLPITLVPAVAVATLTPKRNAPAAPRNTAVAVTFTQPLSNTPATQAALKVFGSQGGKQAGTTTLSGSTLSFAPATPFRAGETVFASVSSTAQGASGVSVLPHVFQFTTATSASPGTFNGGSDLNTAVQIGGNNTTFLDLATGDIDGDGDLDLLTLHSNTSSNGVVSIRLNVGNGTYGSAQQVSVGIYAQELLLSDVDSDGDLDLLTVNYAGSISVRLNNGTGTFSNGQDASAANAATTATTGDVDGDGDQDLLVYASSSNQVYVLFNNGAGVFSSAQTVAANTNVSTMVLGDADNDGDLDLLLNSATTGVSVRLNNGRGTFSGDQTVSTSATPRRIALGDLDNDGDLDLVAVGSGFPATTTASVRLNDGTGLFSGTQEVLINGSALDVTLGDVDGDGDLDLAAGTRGFDQGTTSVRLNDGTGTFSGSQDIATNDPSSISNFVLSVAFGDVDNDGDLDLFSATYNGFVGVRLNQAVQPPTIAGLSVSAGTPGTSVVITGTNFTGATRVTFNGVAELAFVVNSATQITVAVPTGATTGPLTVTTPAGTSNSVVFTVSPSLLITAVTPTRNTPSAPRATPVALTFDQMLSSGTATQGALRVFSTQAGGRKFGTTTVTGNTLSFVPTTSFKPGETVFASLAATVQNSSGNQRLALPHSFQFTAATAPAASVFGNGSEASTAPNPQSVALGDVDGDGDLDVVTANNDNSFSANGTLSVRLNNGNGTYTGTQNVVVRKGPSHVVLADVDGDGDLDLVTANSNSSPNPFSPGLVSVRLNNGSGTFSNTGQDVAVGTSPHAVALGDIDGDGDLDLLAANYIRYSTSAAGENLATSNVSVRLNDGTGTFNSTAAQEVVVGTRPLSIVLGDVDNDGDLDFVTASSNGTTASVRLNDGKGIFIGGPDVQVGFNPYQVTLGDIDKDGDLDLLTANYYDYTNPAQNYTSSVVAVRLNDGKGAFSGTQKVSVGQGSNSLALGDADGDGDLDLFATNSLTNSIGVRLNNGVGAFSGTQQVAVGTNPTYLALGDVDGNGTLDLVTANYLSSNMSVRLNQASSARVLANTAALAEQTGVYPNPAHAFVRLQLPASLTKQALHVSVLNTLGQTVVEQKFSAKQTVDDIQLELGKLAAGVYTVRIRTNAGIVSKRLMVE
ncbi:FG-GAP-like repeat-containing protein [Hymenobacter sp. GOD-10R]|uniref:FG-GAP-like repeat-containing protein n=1 Tax=Hymenobacter sp. GOD-10R TaxID=3093922 RepID=UPI002D78031F|nr:FG-GAP-like repeat-containing protein [Hymenobacter sp. GOD-10R]WRQ28444.1 FG-GAP-like repeat-containing protein [Hymenobacter sp. GOD-10R]